MEMSVYKRFIVSSLVSMALLGSAVAQSTALTLDPEGAVAAHLGYFPVQIKLTDVKPSIVKKEPVYRAKPKYGILKVGDGPKSEYAFALDEPTDADFKIYIDKNQNGDLTDDGDGAWNTKRTKGRVMYGVMPVTLRASYGTRSKETGSSPYTIGIYRFPDSPTLIVYRQTSRDGRITVNGVTHNVMLVENDADAIYLKKAGNSADLKNSRPLWLVLDADQGKKATVVDIRSPFKLDGKNYEAAVSADGFNLRLSRTKKAIVEAAKPAAALPLLKPGTAVPSFTAEKWGGGELNLAEYKGKVVILDFWATWCGPCQKSMPHIEKVNKMIAGQDVVVVGLCVWDNKDAYKEWIPKNQDKYSFQFGFDPAGQAPNNIAAKMFNVSGIPTTYVIDKNGNVADAIVGYEEGDTRLENALKKLGVKI